MQLILDLIKFSLFSPEKRLFISQFMFYSVLHLKQSIDISLKFLALLLYVADPVSLFSSNQIFIVYIEVSQIPFLGLVKLIKLLILSLLFLQSLCVLLLSPSQLLLAPCSLTLDLFRLLRQPILRKGYLRQLLPIILQTWHQLLILEEGVSLRERF
jgi:hypothetical protein